MEWKNLILKMPENMTNEEYREILRDIFEHIEDNQQLRYYCIYLGNRVID